MRAATTLSPALHALRVHRLRTGLALFGIAFGVAAVVLIVAFGSAGQGRLEAEIRDLGADILVVIPGAARSQGAWKASGSGKTLTDADAAAIAQEVPGVIAAAPAIRGTGQVVAGNRNHATVVRGVTPTMFAARPWPVAKGRPLSDDDEVRIAKVALLGHRVAGTLFGETDPTGRVVRIRQVPFTVAGVLEEKGPGLGDDDLDDHVLIPLSTARKRVLGYFRGHPSAVGGVTLKIAEGADMDTAAEAVRGLLRGRHRLADSVPDDFLVRDLAAAKRAQARSDWLMTAMLAGAAGVSLLVGGVGIMNVMLVSVNERRQEIGLRMAVGARRRDIAMQFLIEAALLALLGSTVGVAAAAAATLALHDASALQRPETLAATLLAVCVASLVTLASAAYPARQAAGLDPAEALMQM